MKPLLYTEVCSGTQNGGVYLGIPWSARDFTKEGNTCNYIKLKGIKGSQICVPRAPWLRAAMTSSRPHSRLLWCGSRAASQLPTLKAEPQRNVAHNSGFPLNRLNSFASESLFARQGGQSDVLRGGFFHVFWRRPPESHQGKRGYRYWIQQIRCHLMEPSMLHTSSLSSMTTTTSNENFTYLEFCRLFFPSLHNYPLGKRPSSQLSDK